MPLFSRREVIATPFEHLRGYLAQEDGEIAMAHVLRELGINPYPYTYQGAARILLVRWRLEVKAGH